MLRNATPATGRLWLPVTLGLLLCSGCIHTRSPNRPAQGAGMAAGLVLVSGEAATTRRDAQSSNGRQATEGAATGVVAGLYTAASTGPFALAIAPFAVAAGAVAGAVVVPLLGPRSGKVPERSAKAVDAAMRTAISELELSDRLLAQIEREARAVVPYRVELAPPDEVARRELRASHRAAGYAGVFEARVTQIGFVGATGLDSRLALFMAAEIRQYDAASGTLAARRGLVYQSDYRGDRDWALDDASRVRAEIVRAYVTLARRAVDSELLDEQAETRFTAHGPLEAAVCGLQPLSPPIHSRMHLLARRPGARLSATQIDTRTPTFRWQSLFEPEATPRASQEADAQPTDGEEPIAAPAAARSVDPGAMARVQDIAYDLRVWRDANEDAQALPYERFGLTTTEHRIELPLAPRATYHWSVRARYVHDGKPVALRWTAATAPTTELHPLLQALSYRSALDGDRLVDVDCTGHRPPSGRWSLGARPADSPCGCLDFIPDSSALTFTTPD